MGCHRGGVDHGEYPPAPIKAYNWFLGLQSDHHAIGGLGVDKPLLLWINDALMVFFFMLVGLELKRESCGRTTLETRSGHFARPCRHRWTDGLPAAIFWHINGDFASQKNGWAIPTATDIAFALAILGLLGSRVPISLKIFLTTIAIIDDLAAIVIIAIFYSSDLSMISLGLAGLGIVSPIYALNRMKVMRLAPYMLTALFIWLCVLKSGVHATLAGVVVAAFIPLKARRRPFPCPSPGAHTASLGGFCGAADIRLRERRRVSFYGMSMEKAD